MAADLHAGREEQGAAMGGELEPIIDGADGAEPDEADEAHADVEVIEVRQEQDGNGDGEDDEDSAHGGGAFFVLHHLVHLGLIEGGLVANFLMAEPADHARAKEHDQREAEQHGGCGLEGDIVEYPEKTDVMRFEPGVMVFDQEIDHGL